MNNEIGVRPVRTLNTVTVFDHAREISAKLPHVDPLCQAIMVIPVYREFEGGRLVDLLSEIEGQDVGPGRQETILVVNNSVLSENSNNAGRHDNLKFLDYLQDAQRNGRFLQVQVIDSTDGQIPERHMGLVRGLGQLVAEDRLDQTATGERGIIIQLDADVAVAPDFVSQLLQAYSDPLVRSTMIGRIPLPIDYKSDDYYVAYARQFAYTIATIADGQGSIHTDGPTVSFRASAHKNPSVRNYMTMKISEDFGIGHLLTKYENMYLLAEPRVYKGDRVRPDGFDSARRNVWSQCSISFDRIALLSRLAFGIDIAFLANEFKDHPPIEFWKRLSEKLELENPALAARFQNELDREEVLARRHLDWDNLNHHYKTSAQYLYAMGRLAMSERRTLAIPPEGLRGNRDGKCNLYLIN